MQKFHSSVWVAGIILLLAGVTPAQPPSRGPVRGGANPLLMLRHKAVQDELKLRTDQREKLKEAMMKLRDQMLALVENGEREKVRGVVKEQEKVLPTILKPEQQQRLKQIVLQVHGLWAMTVPETAKELRITEEQNKKLRALQQETEKRMLKLFEGEAATRQEVQKKMAELHASTNEKALLLLSAEQRTQWKAMLGDPFKGEIPRVPPVRPRERP